MIKRVQKAINANTPHLICVKHWFLKQDIPKIIKNLQKSSIEPYTVKLAFELLCIKKNTALMSTFWDKTLNYQIKCVSKLFTSSFRPLMSEIIFS